MEKPSNPNEEPAQTADAQVSEAAALKEQLAETEKKRDEYLLLVKSTRAEFENYQKRVLRDHAAEKKFAHYSFASDILPALDNLDRALAAAKQAGDNSSMTQGVTMVMSQILDIFKRHGIQQIQAENTPFDPNLHKAVMQVPSKDLAPSTVVHVLENGYMMHDRVLRPASVSISSAPTE